MLCFTHSVDNLLKVENTREGRDVIVFEAKYLVKFKIQCLKG